MNGIVWLASYPKSGNTWFRVFLANLLAGGETPVDINSLNSTNFSARSGFDEDEDEMGKGAFPAGH